MNHLLLTAASLVSLLGFSGVSDPALAGGCANHSYGVQNFAVNHHQAVEAVVVDEYHAQQVVAVPTVVNYFVGAPVRQEAVLEAALERVIQNIEARSKTTTTVKETTANYTAPQQHYQPQQQYQPQLNLGQHNCDCGHCNTGSPPVQGGSDGSSASGPPVFSQTAPAQSLVEQACLKCHSDDSPKAGFSLQQPMTNSQLADAIEKVMSGDMPKGATLTQAQKLQLVAELAR